MSRDDIDRGRFGFASFAFQAEQQAGEGQIAEPLDKQPDRNTDDPPAARAVQFQLAVWPLIQAVLQREVRGVHPGRLTREHNRNNVPPWHPVTVS